MTYKNVYTSNLKRLTCSNGDDGDNFREEFPVAEAAEFEAPQYDDGRQCDHSQELHRLDRL